MKDIRTWLILALLLILVFGWLHYSNKAGKTEISNLKEKLEAAVKPHLQAIEKLEADKTAKIDKIKKDSTAAQSAKIGYEKQVSVLQHKLKATHYTGNPSMVTDDSVKIAMQALKEAPVKDSIISVQEKENVRLNSQIATIRVDYRALAGDLNDQIDQQKKISEDYKAFGEAMVKENKKIRRKGIWQSIKIGAVALGVGFVIGLSQ